MEVQIKLINKIDDKENTSEYLTYRYIQPSMLSYTPMSQSEIIEVNGKKYKVDIDAHVSVERLYEKK